MLDNRPGKSTLLNIIGLLDRPSAGRLTIKGEDTGLLADEPTGNLDSATADTVFEMLRKINHDNGTSFLIVTHNADLAGRCDRTIDVVDGRISAGK